LTAHYYTFWFGKSRFAANLVRANALIGNVTGPDVLSVEGAHPISVALRGPDCERFVFYSEETGEVRMDLSGAGKGLTAVAVDTRKPYEEIDLGTLDPEAQTWEAPYPSSWAIAVGVNE
jgi:hypothetical protein